MQNEYEKTTLLVSDKEKVVAPRVEHDTNYSNYGTIVKSDQRKKLCEIWLNDPLEINENNYHPVECSMLNAYANRLADKFGTLNKALDKYGDLKLAISEHHRSINTADKMATLALHQVLKINDTHAVMRVVNGWIYYYITNKNEYTNGVFVADDGNRATPNAQSEMRNIIRRLEHEIKEGFFSLV